MSRIAQRLTDLLLAAFRIPAESIRCTSVEGQGLEGGAKIDDTVREEILSATVVIGLLSETSLASTYVLFEMGARWGAEKPFILLLTPGSTSDVMNGPLANLNALQCDSTELHKLIAQVSERLGKKHEEAHHYTRHIDSLCSSATRPTSPGAASEAGAFTFIRNGRLLVVGAHWDDLLLGCLGTMIKLRRICGYSVDLAVLCSNYPHGYFGRP